MKPTNLFGRIGTGLLMVVLVVATLLLLPFIPFLLLIHKMKGRFLIRSVSQKWFPKNKKILFVYSNSPTWKEHIESEVLPKIKDRAIILNWSEKNTWPDSLAKDVFMYWSGASTVKTGLGKTKWDGSKYCPIAIIFTDSHEKPKVISFWDAYKDFKHGKTEALSRLENELFESA